MDDLSGMRVLVVEDCDDMFNLAAIYLSRAGAVVDRAHDGLEAIEKTRVRTYDAILMDMQMPVLDGLQSTRKLRANGVSCPILALTTNQSSADVADALLAGCDAHIAKPCYGEALIGKVANFY